MTDALPPGHEATRVDALLGDRLRLRQPVSGHRVGTDAVLLAAAAPCATARKIVDVGAGVGAVGLALALRAGAANVDLVEIDPWLAALARDNAEINAVGDRVRVCCVDVTQARKRRDAGLLDGEADLVVTNPPFFDASEVRASPNARRASAHVLPPGADGAPPLLAWLVAALALLAPGGRFVMIHRPDALGECLAAFAGRLGAVRLLPVQPQAEKAAVRLLLTGIKGSKAPLQIQPGFVLHDASGSFTTSAQAVHRSEAVIDWGG